VIAGVRPPEASQEVEVSTEELWSRLEPVLKLLGVEIVPGEPGGYIALPGYPDPARGTNLGDQAWRAVNGFRDAPLTDGQARKLEDLLDAVAKVARYRALAFPAPRGRAFDSDAFQDELRRWPTRKAEPDAAPDPAGG
jgi:hypothetical protein